MCSLDSLDYKCLLVGVIDLTFVLVTDTVGFVFELRLVIPSLSKQGDLSVVVSVKLDSLSNDNTTRVTCVGEVHRLLMQIGNHNCTSAKHAIESLLLFQSLLDCEEARD